MLKGNFRFFSNKNFTEIAKDLFTKCHFCVNMRTVKLAPAQVSILYRRMYFLRYEFVGLHLQWAVQILYICNVLCYKYIYVYINNVFVY